MQLLYDDTAVLFSPFPYSLYKFFPSYIVPRQPLSCKRLLHHILGGYTGVIGAWHPERIVTLHSFVSHDNVLENIIQCVSYMEYPGNIRWRNNYREWFLVTCILRPEQAFIKPALVPFFLNIKSLIRLIQFFSLHNTSFSKFFIGATHTNSFAALLIIFSSRGANHLIVVSLLNHVSCLLA